MKNKRESLGILYMGTFPPRECGIATFTKDLVKAINKRFNPTVKSRILAMNRNGTNIYNYPKEVMFQINDCDIQEYMDTARKVNKMDNIKLVNIQHEFGIFGGNRGSYLIPFLEMVNKPVIITFHSVLPDPDDELKRVVQSIGKKVECIVVMTNKAVQILREEYGLQTNIAVIPHGIPTVAFSSNVKDKTSLGYKDRTILSSFGMVGPGKGYEYVIDALPNVVKQFPDVLYLIIGETHPVVRKNEGEKYRTFLEEKVKSLKLENNVKFYNKYLKLKEIIKYLKATDVYLATNQEPKQITSGTLAYAMGCGKAVISTPFLHAKDVVIEERGMLAEFDDSKSFEEAIIHVLSNPKLRVSMEKNAYYHTRNATWDNVALSYVNTFNKYIEIPERYEEELPKIQFRHLTRLTDKFGMIQFANQIKPDINSGYTLDDNARAMIVCCMHYKLLGGDSKLKLIREYLNFIKYVQKEDGSLYNYVDYDKKINFNYWTNDAYGRALWALGYLISVKRLPQEIKDEAENIFKKALDFNKEIKSPRAVAFMIMGLHYYNKVKPSSDITDSIKKYSDWLVHLYNACSSEGWNWFENTLAYCNSKIPESLFYAYLATKNDVYLGVAKKSLDFLRSVTIEDGMFSPIGNKGWFSKDGKKAYLDQQPVDTGSMVQTLILANKVLKKEEYVNDAFTVFQWFLGKNVLKQVVYDGFTGGCRDGVGESTVNLNQGAESTISYLIARLKLEEYMINKK